MTAGWRVRLVRIVISVSWGLERFHINLPTLVKTQTDRSTVRWCGHDSRGNPTVRIVDGEERVLDEVPLVAPLFLRHKRGEALPSTRLAHQLNRSLIRSQIYVPKYYDPRLRSAAERLRGTHELVRIGDLVESGSLDIATGVEAGKMS